MYNFTQANNDEESSYINCCNAFVHNPTTISITTEEVARLYTARLFLPGFFQRRAFLIFLAALPLIDFITDYINAGTVSFVLKKIEIFKNCNSIFDFKYFQINILKRHIY